jgi:aryl-alcohol dehydrogenase-like predicted oxidoreductase
MPVSSRRQWLAAAALAAAPVRAQQTPAPSGEFRNKQSGMAYRRLGRTGLMLSEVVSGGDPITLSNYDHLNLALDMGLNYLDMAPAYNKGQTEEAYGRLLRGSYKREKVFLTTKVSGFTNYRNQLYKEIYDGLPAPRQESYRRRALELIAQRGVDKPGYFFEYYPGQRTPIEPTYLANAMRADFAHRVEASPGFRDFIVKSIEISLGRVQTGYFDILMCPHGANSPEELDIPEILETFQRLKKDGKVRFLGLTSHTDPGGVLARAAQLGHYDCAMIAYNVINGGYVERSIREAREKDMGVIAMKVAMSVATHHKSLQPTPQWRIEKINRIIPGPMKPPMKAYLWALQNPNLSAVISNLWDRTFVQENVSLAGRKVELSPA